MIHSVHFKRVMRKGSDGVFRVARIVWQRGTVGDGKGWSGKLSLGFTRKFFIFRKTWARCEICIAGVRIHFLRAWGGILS